MSFALRWTEEADSTFRKLQTAASASLISRQKSRKAKASRAEGLFKQVEKCVRLLHENPRHPGLQSHAFDSLQHPYTTGSKVFEAYVQNKTPGAHRLFCCDGPSSREIAVIAITPHP